MVSTAVVFAFGVSPCDAYAQLEPETQLGSRIPVKSRTVDARQAGIVRKNFARCVARLHPDAVEKLVANGDPVTVDLKAAGISVDRKDDLGMKTCLGNQANGVQSGLRITMPGNSLRAMLLEETYLVKFPSAPPLPEGAEEGTGRRYFSTGDALQQAKGLGDFADCVTLKDTPGSDAFVRTMPGSMAERDAARALAPALGGCLFQGQTIALTATNVRAILADGLWNRYVRPSQRKHDEMSTR
jgi:hypothetical protein